MDKLFCTEMEKVKATIFDHTLYTRKKKKHTKIYNNYYLRQIISINFCHQLN